MSRVRTTLKLAFTLTTLLCCGISEAQKKTTFYINPQYGGELAISRFEDKSKQPPFITGTHTIFTINLGVGLMADFNNKFAIELRYAGDNLTTGIKYDTRSDSLRGSSGSHVTGPTIRRLSLRYSKPFRSIRIKRRKSRSFMSELLRVKDEYKYWAVFDLGIIGGITAEYIPPFNPNNSLSIGGSFLGNSNTISEGITNTFTKNRRGFGAFVGVNAQFYQLGKKKFQLGLIYHQGFKKRLIDTWQTSINGVEFPPFDLFTRGSAFAMYLSWPIKLFTINQKVKYNE